MPAVLVLALLLAGCGGGLDGTFEDEMGMSTLTFQGGGKVMQSSPMTSMEVRMAYEVDGDKIRITHPEMGSSAALVLTRIDEDTLAGPMGFRYERKK
ncbi:MAG TPA: hypothetical protein PK743_04470 [Luteimonas sp.]|nr:hypothetical protein [Luteimonas sp.]